MNLKEKKYTRSEIILTLMLLAQVVKSNLIKIVFS